MPTTMSKKRASVHSEPSEGEDDLYEDDDIEPFDLAVASSVAGPRKSDQRDPQEFAPLLKQLQSVRHPPPKKSGPVDPSALELRLHELEAKQEELALDVLNLRNEVKESQKSLQNWVEKEFVSIRKDWHDLQATVHNDQLSALEQIDEACTFTRHESAAFRDKLGEHMKIASDSKLELVQMQDERLEALRKEVQVALEQRDRKGKDAVEALERKLSSGNVSGAKASHPQPAHHGGAGSGVDQKLLHELQTEVALLRKQVDSLLASKGGTTSGSPSKASLEKKPSNVQNPLAGKPKSKSKPTGEEVVSSDYDDE